MKIIIECDNIQELQELAKVISSNTLGEVVYSPQVQVVPEFISSNTLDKVVEPAVVEEIKPKRKYQHDSRNTVIRAGYIGDEVIAEVQRRIDTGDDSLMKICKDMNLKYRTVYAKVVIPKNRVRHHKVEVVKETVVMPTDKQDLIYDLYDNEKLSAKEISVRTGISYNTVTSTIIRRDGKVEKRKLSEEMQEEKEQEKVLSKAEEIQEINRLLDDPNNDLKRSVDMYPPITNELTDVQQQQIVNFYKHKKTDGGRYSIAQISERVGVSIDMVKRVIYNDKRIKS